MVEKEQGRIIETPAKARLSGPGPRVLLLLIVSVVLAAIILVEPNRMPSLDRMKSEREKIGRHVANFKAHRQRFMREREEAASEFKRMLISRQ